MYLLFSSSSSAYFIIIIIIITIIITIISTTTTITFSFLQKYKTGLFTLAAQSVGAVEYIACISAER